MGCFSAAAVPCRVEGLECSALGWIGSVRQCGGGEDEDDDGDPLQSGYQQCFGLEINNTLQATDAPACITVGSHSCLCLVGRAEGPTDHSLYRISSIQACTVIIDCLHFLDHLGIYRLSIGGRATNITKYTSSHPFSRQQQACPLELTRAWQLSTLHICLAHFGWAWRSSCDGCLQCRSIPTTRQLK